MLCQYRLNKESYLNLIGGSDIKPKLIKKPKKYQRFFPDKRGINKRRLMMSDVGLYSVSHHESAKETINIIKKYINRDLKDLTITESNGGVGGDTIAFAESFGKVQTVEIDSTHCDILRNNVSVYGYSNVQIFCQDYLDIYKSLKQDVLFMDPPWGGQDYKLKKFVPLKLDGVRIEKIVNKVIKNDEGLKLVVVKAPFNFAIKRFTKTITKKNKVEIHVEKLLKYELVIIKL